MGRFLLLAVLASVVAGTTLTVSTHQARQNTQSHLVTSETGSFARQAALSGFAAADREVRVDPAGRFTQTDVALAGEGETTFGTYDVAVTDAPSNPSHALVTVTGRFRGATHRIQAVYQSGLAWPSALIGHAQDVTVGGDPAFGIDGSVHQPPSVSNSDWDPSSHRPVAGVSAVNATLAQSMRDDWGGRVGRISGNPAFTLGGAPDWTQDLVDEASTHPGAIIKSSGTYRVTERRVGRPEAPAVVIAEDGAVLKDGTRGYGILIVTGNFRMIDDARWEGLIIVRDTPGVTTTVHIEDDAKVFGSLMLHGIDEAVGPAPIGSFHLRMLDTAKVNWAVEPIEHLVGMFGALGGASGTNRTFLATPRA